MVLLPNPGDYGPVQLSPERDSGDVCPGEHLAGPGSQRHLLLHRFDVHIPEVLRARHGVHCAFSKWVLT